VARTSCEVVSIKGVVLQEIAQKPKQIIIGRGGFLPEVRVDKETSYIGKKRGKYCD